MTSQRRLALPGLGKAPIVLAVLFAAVLPIVIAIVALLQVQRGAVSPVVMLAMQGLVALLGISPSARPAWWTCANTANSSP